jgi:hypothetical protein
VVDAFGHDNRRGLWVPAFAGTTTGLVFFILHRN